MRFLYHLGVHKTGTTLLQNNFAANARALLDQGVYYLNALWPDGLRRIRRRLRRVQYIHAHGDVLPGDNGMGQVNGRIVRRAVAAGARAVLISEENLLGATMHRQMSWGKARAQLCPAAEVCAQVLTAGLKTADMKVLIYTRSLDGLLRGFYSEALRDLATDRGFAEFLEQVDIPACRFDALLRRVRSALPEAEVSVRPFEEIRNGADGFVRGAAAELGIDPAPLAVSPDRVHAGVDRDQAEELRQLAARKARYRASRVLARPANPNLPIELPEQYRAQIDQTMRGDLSETLIRGLSPTGC